VRAANLSIFVVDDGQDLGEEFPAIAAKEFIARYTEPLRPLAITGILELIAAEHNRSSGRAEGLVLLDVLGSTIARD
jgi:hypothetical protein